MIIVLYWSEWLRRVKVDRFNVKSVVAVEDFLEREILDSSRTNTVFVFNDADYPMAQVIDSQWGNGRYSNKQLAEIYNALVGSDEARHVRKFKDRGTAFAQIAIQLGMMTKEIVPRTLLEDTVAKNDTTTAAQDELEQAAGNEVATDTFHVTDALGHLVGDAAIDEAAAADAAQAAAEASAATKKQITAQKKAEKESARAATAEAKKIEKQRKAKEKLDVKAAAIAAKPKGVIASLVSLLTDGNKRTVDELYDELADLFPERGEGMKVTIHVQLVRLNKQGHLIVYSENRYEGEGEARKKIVGKNYWAAVVPPGAAPVGGFTI